MSVKNSGFIELGVLDSNRLQLESARAIDSSCPGSVLYVLNRTVYCPILDTFPS